MQTFPIGRVQLAEIIETNHAAFRVKPENNLTARVMPGQHFEMKTSFTTAEERKEARKPVSRDEALVQAAILMKLKREKKRHRPFTRIDFHALK